MSETDESSQTNPDELTNSVRVPDDLPDELIDERFYNVEWLSVADAAWHFGVSNRAIQKRIAKGQLVSKREGREWRVRLVTSKWAYVSVPNTPDEPIGEPVREPDVPNEPISKDNELLDEPVREPTQALVEQMQSEIAHLREQLQVKDTQIEAGRIAESELRRLLLSRDMEIARLQQENRLLLAAPPVEEPIQDTLVDSPVPQTAAETSETVNKALGEETSVQQSQETAAAKPGVTVWDVPAPRKAWWKFWDRGR